MAEKPRIQSLTMPGHDLFSDQDAWLTQLVKAVGPAPEGTSNQGNFKGTLPHLINYSHASDLKNNNVHHSTCLEAKRDALVGLGHKHAKINEILDPLCDVSWQDTLNDVTMDYLEFGNGYLEVVRNAQGRIIGLFHLPCPHVWIFVEENATLFHFEVSNQSKQVSDTTLRFPRFGDKEAFMRRNKRRATGGLRIQKKGVSEVIHFPRSSNRSRHYGYIDWAAATPSMELESCVTQYEFDFFLNGGVPDGIFSVIGKDMTDEDWEALKTEFRSHVGLGNRRKVMLLNLGDPDLKAQFDRLVVDGQSEGQFKDFSDTLALKVVSAHRVPPLIAGIQIPGKLGAANELTNAMMAFQVLAVSGPQRHFSNILACTLGNPELNGGLALSRDDFLGVGAGDPEMDPTQGIGKDGMPAMRPKDHKGNGFNTILDEIDLGQADTIARMRQPLMQAQAEGRNLDEGVKERGDE